MLQLLFSFLFFQPSAVIRFAHVSSLRLVDASHLCSIALCAKLHVISRIGSVPSSCAQQCFVKVCWALLHVQLQQQVVLLLFQPSAVIRFAHVSTQPTRLCCRCFASLHRLVRAVLISHRIASLVCMCIHVSADSGEETPLGGFSPSGAFLISYANYKYPRTHYICRAFNFCL